MRKVEAGKMLTAKLWSPRLDVFTVEDGMDAGVRATRRRE